MELGDYRKLRDELERDYFLIGKHAFWGGFIACLVIVAGVGWTSVRTALATSAEGLVMERLKEGQMVADELIKGSRAVPLGAIILIDSNRECPESYAQISNFGVLTLIDSKVMTNETIERTKKVTIDSVYKEDRKNWDRRQFKACLLEGN